MQRSTQKGRRPPKGRQLRVERLEDRRMLAMYLDQASLDAADEFALDSRFESVGWLAGSGNDGSWVVAGSAVLINSEWLLTAGHVAEGAKVDGYSSLYFSLSTSIYGSDPGYVQADAWYVYPGYSSDVGVATNVDLALIHLSEAVVGVSPAVLYSGEDERGTVLYAAGYGAPGTVSSGVGDFDGVKRAGSNVGEAFGDDPPWVFAENQYWFSSFDAYDSNKQSLEWQSTPGDSGAGYFAYIDGQWQLVGINSGIWGDQGNGYSVGIRTSLYLDWIYDTTGITPGTEVPEPGSMSLLSTGLLAVFSRARRKVKVRRRTTPDGSPYVTEVAAP